MSILRIYKYGEPILKRKSMPVEEITPKIRKLISDMIETMYNAPGVGLAACQVGVPLKICVIHLRSERLEGSQAASKPFVLINPKITGRSGKIEEEEGCLSLPGITVKIKRSRKVKVQAIDDKGMPIIIEGEGLLGRALQHEIDHIEGKVLIDYLPWLKRRKVEREIKERRKQENW